MTDEAHRDLSLLEGRIEKQRQDDAQDREDRAVRLAVDRAVTDARMTARLDEHQRHLEEINGHIKDMAACQAEMVGQLRKLQEDRMTDAAIAEALRTAVDQASTRQVSTRTFVLGVVSVIASLGALLATVHG